MTVFTAALTGAGTGLGVWLLAYSLRRPRLAELLAVPSAAVESTGENTGGWARRYGRAGAGFLAAVGLPTRRIRRDLALSDHGSDDYLAEKASAAVAAVAVPFVLATVVGALALPVPLPTLLVVAAGIAVACWTAPDIAVIEHARRRRAELRAATSVFADVVVIALAGGAGVSGALTQAASYGEGWAPARVRLALHAAAMHRQSPWQALGDLAHRTGVPELAEFAASLQLAGTDGARVRASVAAKAAALRTRDIAAADAACQAATERMSLPVMVLVLGFLLLIGYPALIHIVSGF
ncbi:type II secretion system F family protein [Nocardiopsis trehalosi]|uniref:type II secretion system F family protein n=1 Tax=Nocardiopsis trehalosi TaxID=109329 RepID=UPI00082C5B42|nr:type II secretion system F family protein [Nocardiopsis trehalosi]